MLLVTATVRGETLVFSASDNPPLLEPAPGKPGFFNLLFDEISRRLEIEIILQKMPSERGLLSVRSGMLDGDISRVADLAKQFPELSAVPEPVLMMEFVYLARHGEPGWSALHGKEVGIVRGWKIAENRLRGKARLVAVREPTQLLDLLLLDRVDAVVYGKYQGRWLMERMDVERSLAMFRLESRPMHILFHKSREAWVEPFNEALISIYQDGSYAAMLEMALDRNHPEVARQAGDMR